MPRQSERVRIIDASLPYPLHSRGITTQILKSYTGRRSETTHEFIRLLPVAAVTSVIDFGLLILLTEAFGLHYLTSAAIAFLAGQVWSYVMSVKWVFTRFSAPSHYAAFPPYLVLSAAGLLFTEVFLWAMTEHGGLYYLYSKMVTSATCFILLFFARKRLLFS